MPPFRNNPQFVQRLSGSDSNGVRTEFDAELVREENEVEADAEA